MAWSNIIRQTAAEWTAQNPILVDNYSGYETDTGKMKAGDGVTTWNSLAYLSPNAGTFTSLVTAQAGLTVTTAPIIAPASTTSIANLNTPSGVLKTTPIAGDHDYDGVASYITNDTTGGRGFIPVTQYCRLSAAGSAISTIANFFGASSGIPLVASTSAYYDIEFFLWFTNSADTNTATFTLSYGGAAPTLQNVFFEMSPAAGIVAPPGTATALTGQYIGDATQAKAFNTAALGSAATYYAHFKIWVQSKAAVTGLNLQCTKNVGGTITPKTGSYWTARRLPAANTGLFV